MKKLTEEEQENLNRLFQIRNGKPRSVKPPPLIQAKNKLSCLGFQLFMASKRNEIVDWPNAEDHGKEFGAVVKHMYPEKSNPELLDMINKNEVKETMYTAIYSIYRSPNTSQKSKEAFFREVEDSLERNPDIGEFFEDTSNEDYSGIMF